MANQKIDVSNCNSELISGGITQTFPAPTTDTKSYYFLKAEWTFNILSFNCKTDSGTATVVVKKNGSAVTGLSGVSCTSTISDTDITPVAVAAGDNITVEFSAVSSPINLCAELIIART